MPSSSHTSARIRWSTCTTLLPPPTPPTQVYNQVMAGLYLAQLTLLGVLGLKRFVFAPLGVPLLLATAAQHANTLRRYRRPWWVAVGRIG